jgi:hypothetical protein
MLVVPTGTVQPTAVCSLGGTDHAAWGSNSLLWLWAPRSKRHSCSISLRPIRLLLQLDMASSLSSKLHDPPSYRRCDSATSRVLSVTSFQPGASHLPMRRRQQSLGQETGQSDAKPTHAQPWKGSAISSAAAPSMRTPLLPYPGPDTNRPPGVRRVYARC